MHALNFPMISNIRLRRPGGAGDFFRATIFIEWPIKEVKRDKGRIGRIRFQARNKSRRRRTDSPSSMHPGIATVRA